MKKWFPWFFLLALLIATRWIIPIAPIGPVLAQNYGTGSITATGSISGVSCSPTTSCVVAQIPQGFGGASVTVSGTWVATLTFYGSGDGKNFATILATPLGSTSGVTTTTANGVWQVKAVGVSYIMVLSTAYTSGTAVVTIQGSQASLNIGGGGGGSFTAGGDLSGTSSSQTVIGINGTNIAALATGLYYNTTSTGVPSIATATQVLAAATGGTGPLLVSGIVDGDVPVTKTTGTSATLGGGTYQSGYTFNQEGTAGTGVTYTLPATVTGMQYCVANSGTTSVVNTGVLTVYPPASSYVIYNGVVNTVGGGGTHGIASAGAAGDGACFVAIDSTHWQVYVQSGTWTEN